eukprot:6467531-Amphidinium_carterae.1
MYFANNFPACPISGGKAIMVLFHSNGEQGNATNCQLLEPNLASYTEPYVTSVAALLNHGCSHGNPSQAGGTCCCGNVVLVCHDPPRGINTNLCVICVAMLLSFFCAGKTIFRIPRYTMPITRLADVPPHWPL